LDKDSAKTAILVVAEESDTRIFLSKLLVSAGWIVVEAVGMADGLRLAKEEKPGLVVLDVMMSNREGIQLYHHMRNEPLLRRIPVIMISAIDWETFSFYEKFQVGRMGPSVPEPEAFMEKPVEAEELLGELDRLLGGDTRPEPPETVEPEKLPPIPNEKRGRWEEVP
jgi:CheY-like chemotaxis protein